MARRIVDLEEGTAMVVTDLHGEGDIYYRLRDHYLSLYERGQAQRLIICGDLIHGYGEEADDSSLYMLLDFMQLRERFGDQVHMLLGNHEMPHIYSITLTKGEQEFTSRFEAALARLDQQPDGIHRRSDVIAFLAGLPFYVRTKAGVLLSHAGASAAVNTPEVVQKVMDFDHAAVLQTARNRLKQYDIERLRQIYTHNSRLSYEQQAKHFLAVSGPEDPRYDDLLNTLMLEKNDDFTLLWDILFNYNEKEAGLAAYESVTTHFLKVISLDSAWKQRVIVGGHIVTKGGYAEVGSQHLRLASYAHARPRESGRYLLLDCAKPIETASQLISHLRFTLDGGV